MPTVNYYKVYSLDDEINHFVLIKTLQRRFPIIFYGYCHLPPNNEIINTTTVNWGYFATFFHSSLNNSEKRLDENNFMVRSLSLGALMGIYPEISKGALFQKKNWFCRWQSNPAFWGFFATWKKNHHKVLL